MILTTHALVGAAIGEKINNPWIIVILSLAMHFALDSFRHGEYFDDRVASIRQDWWKVAIDLSVCFSVVLFFIFYSHADILKIRNIFLGVFFSLLPDFLTLLYWKFNFKFLAAIKRFHAWSHNYEKFPKYSAARQWTLRNAANDIIISLIAIIILFVK